jgi:hypothetical protein
VRRLERDQIIRFLRAVDSALKDDVEVFVVGGLAAILQYDAAVKTADMDVYAIVEGRQSDLKHASRVATDATGITLAINPATITELPWNYEDRLKRVRGLRLKKLHMIVPDKYDLVLSKALRGHEHDLETIASIHEHHHLAEKTLAQRFEDEIWKIAVGNPRNFARNMLQVMQMLYGASRAKIYRSRWGLDT